MRTNIDIDDELLAEAMRITGLSTKKAVVDAALRRMVRDESLRAVIQEMKGLGWEGDLQAQREAWGPPNSASRDTPDTAAAE